MRRTSVVAGNWKMNPPTRQEAVELAQAVATGAEGVPSVIAVICPPTIWLDAVSRSVAGRSVAVGAQTMHAEERGAFTGETSPLMLAGVAEVKPDRMIRRFVATALGVADVDPQTAASLLVQVQRGSPGVSLRALDHAIWQYQRTQARGQRSA